MQQAQAQQLSHEEVAVKARETVARAIQRNVPGLPEVASPVELDLEVGPTPKDVVHSRGTMKLYHYRPLSDEVYRVPVLVVMSLVSRSYILDLAKGQSFIEYLLLQGFDVYLIDWGVPRQSHKHLKLDDYVTDFIPECVDVVREDSGEPDISMIGYCLGGFLAALYAALYPDGPLKNLVCFTTPINSDGMPMYRTWTDPAHFDIDQLIDSLGNIPSELMDASIQMLRPFQKSAGQMKLLDNVQDEAFVTAHLRFDRWAADHVPFPGETARQLVNDFMRENKIVRNQQELAGRKVDLSKITMPFLHVAAKFDHIVPSAASQDLVKLVGSKDKSEIVLKGGHVSLVAGGNAIYRLWPQLDEWLSQRSV